MQEKSSSTIFRVALLVLAVLVSGATARNGAEPTETAKVDIEFTDVKKQTREFMEYYETIDLTREQELVKLEALSKLSAACCADNSAYTCCCVCNLSRTVWGLTAYLIAERDYGAAQVREAVREWIRFVNPDGFSGDACYRGGCARSFENNGCGGMSPGRVIW